MQSVPKELSDLFEGIHFQSLSLNREGLWLPGERDQHLENVERARPLIVASTAIASVRGLGGHTGRPYDVVPEYFLLRGLAQANPSLLFPGPRKSIPDAGGHGCNIHYLGKAVDGIITLEQFLFCHRVFGTGLVGHLEADEYITHSSGRLGHVIPGLIGAALRYPDMKIPVLSTDGSAQEPYELKALLQIGQRQLNFLLAYDMNDVTITGHPSQYFNLFTPEKFAATLQTWNIKTSIVDGENPDELFAALQEGTRHKGPYAVLVKRRMAQGIRGVGDKGYEGKINPHDAIDKATAQPYFRERRLEETALLLDTLQPAEEKPRHYTGTSVERQSLRGVVTKTFKDILLSLPQDERPSVLALDCDLKGSTKLTALEGVEGIQFVQMGIDEPVAFAAAGGYGLEDNSLGVVGTFTAFATSMPVSIDDMLRLDHRGRRRGRGRIVFSSHYGIDEMGDGDCHFGDLAWRVDAPGVAMYLPADVHQAQSLMRDVVGRTTHPLRFVFTPRSETPVILKEDGTPFYDESYKFTFGKDDLVRTGGNGYIVTTGAAMLTRVLDAVAQLRYEGIEMGVIYSSVPNVLDRSTIQQLQGVHLVLIVDEQRVGRGLGVRYGSWMMEQGVRFDHYAQMGATEPGRGGTRLQMFNQGLEPGQIIAKVKN